jgi:hypothetical protein
MLIRPVVNEKSTAYLSAEFLNKADGQDAPASISYRIDCLTSGQEVKGDTPVTPPNGIVEIPLSPGDTAIINTTEDYEVRLVTVTATYGASDALSEEFEYIVKNLRKK